LSLHPATLKLGIMVLGGKVLSVFPNFESGTRMEASRQPAAFIRVNLRSGSGLVALRRLFSGPLRKGPPGRRRPGEIPGNSGDKHSPAAEPSDSPDKSGCSGPRPAPPAWRPRSRRTAGEKRKTPDSWQNSNQWAPGWQEWPPPAPRRSAAGRDYPVAGG